MNRHSEISSRSESGSALRALLLIAPVPTLGVAAALFLVPGPLGSTMWGIAKLWLLVVPAWWVRYVEHQPWSLSPLRPGGLRYGVLIGFIMMGVIIGTYCWVGRHQFDAQPMRTLLAQAGLSTPIRYGFLATYWSVGNSLIEEYVFRWFIFRQCERLVLRGTAVMITACIFTLHHTLALTAYLPWHLNGLASVGILAAAVIWSTLYSHFRSIWPAYVCHALADVAVFIVGYDALFIASGIVSHTY